MDVRVLFAQQHFTELQGLFMNRLSRAVPLEQAAGLAQISRSI
jgi:hypothetical protein